MRTNISIDIEKIRAFCQKWQITEFSLFGSVLRDDFHAKSDVDVLVTFAPAAKTTGLDWVMAEEELAIIFGRDVDLISRRGIEQSRNSLRRHEILSTAEVIYAEAA